MRSHVDRTSGLIIMLSYIWQIPIINTLNKILVEVGQVVGQSWSTFVKICFWSRLVGWSISKGISASLLTTFDQIIFLSFELVRWVSGTNFNFLYSQEKVFQLLFCPTFLTYSSIHKDTMTRHGELVPAGVLIGKPYKGVVIVSLCILE